MAFHIGITRRMVSSRWRVIVVRVFHICDLFVKVVSRNRWRVPNLGSKFCCSVVALVSTVTGCHKEERSDTRNKKTKDPTHKTTMKNDVGVQQQARDEAKDNVFEENTVQ